MLPMLTQQSPERDSGNNTMLSARSKEDCFPRYRSVDRRGVSFDQAAGSNYQDFKNTHEKNRFKRTRNSMIPAAQSGGFMDRFSDPRVQNPQFKSHQLGQILKEKMNKKAAAKLKGYLEQVGSGTYHHHNNNAIIGNDVITKYNDKWSD